MNKTFIKTILLSFLFFGIVQKNMYSQNNIIGIVYDAENNETLIGANVYFPDLHRGAITDNLGKFSIENIASGKFDMFVGFLGYKNKLIKLQTDTVKSEIIIFLKKEAFQSEEIIVSGSRFSLQHENAIEVNSIKLSEIENGKANLFEQLAEVPGVDVISKGAGVAKPVIRGLSNTNILFIDNGIRMENFQFSENHPFMVDEFGIERIEVIKGPASLLYGSDAVGGVLFAIREKPPHSDKLQGDYSINYFDNSKGLHSSIGLQAANKNFHAGVRASIKSHKDYIDGDNQQVANTRFNQKSLKSVLGYSYKFIKFDLYYDYTQMVLGMCVPPAINLTIDNYRENKVWYQNLANHVVSVKNKLFFNNLKLDINAAYQSNNRTLMTSDLTPQFKMVDMLLNTLSSEIKFTYSLEKGEVIVGSQTMYQSNKNADAPDHVIPDATVKDMSAFGLYSTSLWGKVHIQTGLRYDFRNITTKMYNVITDIDNNYENYSYSSGITYQATEKLLLRTNYASAHRSPNIAEITQDGMHGAYYERGNRDLKSQKNYEQDLSLHYHAKKFIFEITSFYNHIDNYIFLQRTNELTPDNVPIYQYSQTNADIIGFETGIKVMPLDFIQFKTNYAFLYGEQENGDYLPFIPQNKLKATLKFSKKEILFFKKPYFRFLSNRTKYFH